MSSFFKAHRFIALVVLIAAGIWVGTGEFSSVGSEEAQASQPETGTAGQAPAETAAEALHTVGAMAPVFTDHAREIRVSASTEADKSAVLAARSNGVILKLPVAQGASVAADALVMEVEGADIVAAVATAEASLAQASREMEMQEELLARGNTPELQVIRARSAEAAAKSQLSQAVAAADRLFLRAPFAGVVDTVDVEIGEWVQAGTPVATLLSLDPIVVRAEIGELDMGEIEVGATADVRLVTGPTLKGTVRDIARAANTQTRTFAVEIAVPNPDGAIPAGLTAEVSLYARPVRASLIPRSVITLSSDGRIGVRVVDGSNVTGFAPVKIVDDTAQGLMVTGIPEDIRVVVMGQDLVRDGETVEVREVPPGALAAEGAAAGAAP